MWKEPRWILVRRILCYELIQRLFFEVVTSIWEQNREDPPDLRRLVVEEIFGQNYEKFLQTNKWDVWCRTWDGNHEGWVSAPVIYSVSKRVGSMGPLAALMGRIADDHICTEAMTTGKAVREVIEDSVESYHEGIYGEARVLHGSAVLYERGRKGRV